jgi:hypothetical protein
MKTSEFDSLWENPTNWRWRLVYVCKSDPRVIVPKKPKWMGRTLNFAHRKAYLVLILTILAVVTPLLLLPFAHIKLLVALYIATLLAVIAFYYSTELRIRK